MASVIVQQDWGEEGKMLFFFLHLMERESTKKKNSDEVKLVLMPARTRSVHWMMLFFRIVNFGIHPKSQVDEEQTTTRTRGLIGGDQRRRG